MPILGETGAHSDSFHMYVVVAEVKSTRYSKGLHIIANVIGYKWCMHKYTFTPSLAFAWPSEKKLFDKKKRRQTCISTTFAHLQFNKHQELTNLHSIILFRLVSFIAEQISWNLRKLLEYSQNLR